MRYACTMKRTSVMLADGTYERLRHESRRRGTSVAMIVREAVEQHLPEPETGKPLSFFAVGEGPPDGSEHVDEYVGAVVAKRARQRARC